MTDKYVYTGVAVPTKQATPISGTVDKLCATEMPDGRAFAVYRVSGTEIKGLVFDTPQTLLYDSVAASASGTTLVSADAAHLSCFAVGSDIYINALLQTGSGMSNVIYKANDPNDPLAGFTLHATLDTTSGGGRSGTSGAAGIPTVIGSRWVLASSTVSSTLGISFMRMGVFVSENNGVSWVQKVDLGFYLVGGSYMDAQNGQVNVLPNGDLLVIGWGGPTGVQRARSVDDGVTWTTDNPAGEGSAGPYLFMPVVNNGTACYAVRTNTWHTIGNDGLSTGTIGTTTFNCNYSDGNFKSVWCPLAGILIYPNSGNKIAGASKSWKVGSLAW